MNKAFEYRIYPTAEQRQLIERTFGCCRFVYNEALYLRTEAYKAGRNVPSINDCIKMLPAWKADADRVWLAEADSMALQQSLRDLGTAFTNFFRNVRQGRRVGSKSNPYGHPRFKSKRDRHQSYRTQCPPGNKGIEVVDGKHIKLPKLGYVKARISRLPQGRITSATVKRTPAGKYFCVILCTDATPEPLQAATKACGIDLGLHTLATVADTDGLVCEIENPRYLRKAEKRLARAQRRLSRRQGARKGERAGANYKRQRTKVALLHEKVANCRRDFIQKATTKLIAENQAIGVESLRVRNMSRSAKGTVEEPGRNVRAKSGLNRAIHDAGWGEFTRQLAYKAEWYGRELVKVDAFFPSSQLCSGCGHINPAVKDLKVRAWVCPVCGAVHQRDPNAAINILNVTLQTVGWDAPEPATPVASACGEQIRPSVAFVRPGHSSLKQEPTERVA